MNIGRQSRHGVNISAAHKLMSAGKRLVLVVAATTGVFLAGADLALAAENSIKQIQVRRDGDQVLLKVQLSAPMKTLPGNWSVVDPPRVVIDFPETDNQTGQTLQQVNEGDLKSLNLVQTDKLTRMVLNLYRPTKFSTEMVGDALFIRMQGQSPQATVREQGPSIFQPTPAAAAGGKAVTAAENAAVRDIVFRRGEDGQANIIVDLTDGTVPIDVRRTSTGVSVELRDVELPERLQNRRNVNDFATPVSSITSKGLGNVTNLEIAARGRWFHQAHLANNQLIIEVRPIPVDDANKLVQSGEQGQKISINFFEADATMVVRTLAEISGKNIMIDPSLAGRRLTISLDSVPYDQALEIVMTQINAAMRVRDSIVLFGDRAILQKRDEDIADAAARAADIAQLVTEVFQLSYLKPTDFQKLLLGASTGGSTNQTSSTGAAGAAGGGQASGSSGGGSASGSGSANVSGESVRTTTSTSGARGGGGVILSPRGKMFAHDDSRKLFVTDTVSVLESIRNMITEMDIPTKQVLIEARIVEATTGFTNSFGMRMNVLNFQRSGLSGSRHQHHPRRVHQRACEYRQQPGRVWRQPHAVADRQYQRVPSKLCAGRRCQHGFDALQPGGNQTGIAGTAGRRNRPKVAHGIGAADRDHGQQAGDDQQHAVGIHPDGCQCPDWPAHLQPGIRAADTYGDPKDQPGQPDRSGIEHRQGFDHQRDDGSTDLEHGDHKCHRRERRHGGDRRIVVGVRIPDTGKGPLPRRPALCRLSVQDYLEELIQGRIADLHHAPHRQRSLDPALSHGQQRGPALPARAATIWR
jgi:uncharacterized membrane protein YgcG